MQIIDKSISNTTKQDVIDNIPGKFGLLCSYSVIDEDVLNAAGKLVFTYKNLFYILYINAYRSFMLFTNNL